MKTWLKESIRDINKDISRHTVSNVRNHQEIPCEPDAGGRATAIRLEDYTHLLEDF